MVTEIEFVKTKQSVSWKSYIPNEALGIVRFRAAPKNERNGGWLAVFSSESYVTTKDRTVTQQTMVTLDVSDAIRLRDMLNSIDWVSV